ncbi:MICOS complex subunit mic25-a [Halotydeus destructor]|nr:MICOS complex subunit mic25-a [Halotydeus destructor]
MGASESTRKLTIINEDTSGVIKITDSVARKLQGEPDKPEQQDVNVQAQQQRVPPSGQQVQSNQLLFAAPMETLTLRKRHEEQLQSLEASWRQQKVVLEHANRTLWKTTTTRIASDLKEIEDKYISKRRYDPICPDKESSVESCYKNNAKTPLKCSEQVKDFVGCVDVAKRAALVSKGSLS